MHVNWYYKLISPTGSKLVNNKGELYMSFSLIFKRFQKFQKWRTMQCSFVQSKLAFRGGNGASKAKEVAFSILPRLFCCCPFVYPEYYSAYYYSSLPNHHEGETCSLQFLSILA